MFNSPHVPWRFLRWPAAAVLAVAAHGAFAQGYPSKPIRLVVPYAAGGATDVTARLFGLKFSEAWGQQVIVDNRPGAGANIGADAVAKAAPDGYPLLINTSTQAIAPGLYRKLPYDAAKDLVAVTQLVSTSFILVANPQLPAATVKELIALAKAQPGKLNLGSSGLGTAPHIVGEMLRSAAGIDVVHVPYKGDAPLTPALLSNEVQFAFLPSQAALPPMRAGKLRALAVTGASRSASAPEVPTMIESGVPDFEFIAWVGLFVPGGTPRDIVNKIAAEAARILRTPEVAKHVAASGTEPAGTTPEAFAARYRAEIDLFAKIIREAKIPPVD